MMEWALIVSLYSCIGGGGDPGIVPGACTFRDVPVSMPSREVCKQIRDFYNEKNGIKAHCVGTVLD